MVLYFHYSAGNRLMVPLLPELKQAYWSRSYTALRSLTEMYRPVGGVRSERSETKSHAATAARTGPSNGGLPSSSDSNYCPNAIK